MFRGAAAPNAFDAPVAKATDENLTSEDWGAIIEVCDKVSSDPNGPNQVVQSLIKRLAHRNANVQLYTLELANALSQNCGKNVHRELSSRAFTDALLKLANDRNTHQQVKAKILERTKEWSNMFSNDADLGIMYDAYYRLKQSNPTLQPPSAPQKNSLTEVDRQKEEEELQMALKLSLQEEERKRKASESAASPSAGPSASSGTAGAGDAAAQAEPLPPHPTGTTAATVSRVRALYDFVPSEPGELEFKKGDVIAVLESVYKDWWRGSLKGKTGIFPLNYVEKLTDPTPGELQREAQMEAEVFAEIKNVEKLLTLLSTSNTAPREEDNEEISTLAIRPKLIKLIEKYSQKKDDFTQLNEKFIKARRDYEALLESSMSHPPQPNYHQYAPRPAIAQGYGGPGGPGGPGPAYAPQGPPTAQQEPQRYYTPGPQGPAPQEQNQFQATSPPPNFQRQTPGPAPFYLQGAEVPPQAGQQPPVQQQFPPGDQPSRLTNAGKQPAPIQTSSPPPQSYHAYSQQPSQTGPRPQSTYGNPQELATSAYDSPVAGPNQGGGGPSDPYSAPAYSQEDGYGADQAAPSAPPPAGPAQPHFPTPLAYGTQQPSAPPQQPQYSAYNPNRPAQRREDASSPSYDEPPPPQPTGPAPPVPQAQAQAQAQAQGPGLGQGQPPSAPYATGAAPLPLQPGGPAYDAGQPFHSQLASPPQPQYKAYVPPESEPSAPQDYYRQSAY
ncbi:hypothetical protein DL771_002154 [Monosporascus sp. 5C6A]|nr:hypothetical protein DL771_002154 [Monosporascus sp. 5C6A]